MSKVVRKTKISRLLNGNAPRVLDLFAGCGGLSLGFAAAGFHISGALEIDSLAAQSHALNFHRQISPEERDLHGRARDITSSTPSALVKELHLGRVDAAVDVIIGGPPCQAFARVGRAKLREVAEHPQAFLSDGRSQLYLSYLDYVREMQPLVILVENVPDVLNFGGHNIAQEMCDVLQDLGYAARYTLLNAAFYGVPQMRERMFLLAYAEELGADVQFPAPRHWMELPAGYQGSRSVALKNIRSHDGDGGSTFADESAYTAPPSPAGPLPPPVSARNALGDLPNLREHLEGRAKRGARRFDELLRYPEGHPISDFARLMRSWPGFENAEGLYDHVVRSTPRDYAIFRVMNPGDQYPQAYGHAIALFEAHLTALKDRGGAPQPGTDEYEAIKASIVPPYDPGKFPNKWRKMEADLPARTLMAHLGKDSYSHIHYDSEQARTISVREAARLQSFPDGFRFAGTMNPAFRQIGNAVPPLLSHAISLTIMATLGLEPRHDLLEGV